MSTDMFPDSFIRHVIERHEEMRRRLTLAYHEAMAAAHASGSVSIHVGSSVLTYLQDLCIEPEEKRAPWLPAQTTAWGFHVIAAPEELGPNHLSVHVVTVIP